MRNDRFAHPIWDLDPAQGDRPDYDDYERLFLAAYRRAFRLHPTPRRVRPYVMRYMRFYVAAPWARDYARAHAGDVVAEEVAAAPVDPLLDWRHIARWIEGALPFWFVPREPPPPGLGRFPA